MNNTEVKPLYKALRKKITKGELADALTSLIASISEVLPYMEIEANEDGDLDNHAYQIYLKAIGAKNDAEEALSRIS